MCRMYVDEVLIRVFHNHEAHGQPYLSRQPMGVYSSLFDGSQWATRGGLDKIDFTHGPFHAHYTDYVLDACAMDETNPFASAHCVDPSSSKQH
jgi:xyloglucan:xyloglucosyl transferase